MRFTALAASVLTLAAGVAGCGTVVSIRPLYTDADLREPIVEPRIEGEWISPNMDSHDANANPEARWKITAAVGYYSVECVKVEQEGDTVAMFHGRLVSIGDGLFFDAELAGPNQNRPVLVPTHVVGRVWVQQDFLRLALLGVEWVEDHSTDGFRIAYGREVFC